MVFEKPDMEIRAVPVERCAAPPKGAGGQDAGDPDIFQGHGCKHLIDCMNEKTRTGGSNERVGLFGGTFNPVHLGHVKAARDVKSRFGLDRIYFIPSAQPPHKPDARLAPAHDRYAMVMLGLEGADSLFPCDVEIQRDGPSYSVDTVAFFKKRMGPGGELFFILGVDAFLEIDTWKSYEALLRQVAFIVMSRPTKASSETDLYKVLASYIKETLSSAYVFNATRGTWFHPSLRPIYPVAVSPVDIASSQLREKLRLGEPADRWLSPGVADYIKQKGLYR